MKRSYLSAPAVNSVMALKSVILQREARRRPTCLARRGRPHVRHVTVVVEVVAVRGPAVAVEPEGLLQPALDVLVVAVGRFGLHLDGYGAATPRLLEHSDDVA